jgi:hypothetical protein
MIKKIIRNLSLIILLALLCSWLIHKFYLSLTEIRFNPDTERIEVSMRIFPDDLDRALMYKTGINTMLATELEPPGADSLLMEYLLESFQIIVNGKTVALNYLGKEPEADAIWCYLESEQINQPVTIMVTQALLTETFEEQVNIVQVYQGKWNKGLLLNRQEQSGELTIGK